MDHCLTVAISCTLPLGSSAVLKQDIYGSWDGDSDSSKAERLATFQVFLRAIDVLITLVKKLGVKATCTYAGRKKGSKLKLW
jgi:hypothetical protein